MLMGMQAVDIRENIGTPFIIGAIDVNGTTYPVYRKIINFGALPNNAEKKVASGITPNCILSLSGIATNTTNGFTQMIPNPNSEAAYTVTLTFNHSKEISIITKSDRSSFDRTLITIDYY